MDAEITHEFEKLHAKIDKLTEVVSTIGIHESRISTVEKKVQGVCESHNDMFKPGGPFPKVVEFQQSCPRNTHRAWFVALWLAIVTLVGALIKVGG